MTMQRTMKLYRLPEASGALGHHRGAREGPDSLVLSKKEVQSRDSGCATRTVSGTGSVTLLLLLSPAGALFWFDLLSSKCAPQPAALPSADRLGGRRVSTLIVSR